jgi:2-polyprenyl-3-methyl-5-hydroxy-6-metoxy-1,4-benzoquinol methylase
MIFILLVYLKTLLIKNVLLLASGGGQQSSIFGILNAKVTVLDLSTSQLENDKKAAKHYGYKVKTIEGEIANLSALKIILSI